jgi:hypothetical protein
MAPRRYEFGLAPYEDDAGKTIDELLHQDEYRAPELAELLGMPLSVIEHEALTGHLRSFIVEHHVICIRRDDALAWLDSRR